MDPAFFVGNIPKKELKTARNRLKEIKE